MSQKRAEDNHVCSAVLKGKNMDTSKNLMEIKSQVELAEALRYLLKEISKFHPEYPVYGYDYEDGKIISVLREEHDYL